MSWTLGLYGRVMVVLSLDGDQRNPLILDLPRLVGGRCDDRGAPRDRGAGLIQLEFGAFVVLLGICRPVPRSGG